MPFFAFGPFAEEIERKLAAVEKPAAQLATELVVQRPGLAGVWAQLERLPFDDVYPNYLNHPVRVAGSLLAVRPHADDEELTLALCHNVREAGVEERLDLPPRVAAAVATLTIDRARERDPIYLDAFYDGIERAGLIVLKALDKLDNALEWARYDVDAHDVRVVLEQVCPRVEREDARLSEYLRDLTHYVAAPVS